MDIVLLHKITRKLTSYQNFQFTQLRRVARRGVNGRTVTAR